MSNAMIHMVPEKFGQAPGYYSDASSNIYKAMGALSSYKSSLRTSGFESRCSSYTTRYNSINNSISSVNYYATYLTTSSESILLQYEQFEAQNTGGSITAPDTSSLANSADYANTGATTGETKEDNTIWENICGFFVKVVDGIKEFIEGLVATFLDIVSSLLQGLCSLVEGIIDCVVLLGGTLVGLVCSAINFIFGTEIDVQAIKDWVMGFVATDWVGSAFSWFYNKTAFGRWMADNSIIYDTWAKDILVGAGKWIGIIAIDAAILYFSGGAAAPLIPKLTALLAGTSGFGQGAQAAYANGASFAGGLGLGVLQGGFDAFVGYGVGNVVNALSSTMTTMIAKDGTMFALRRVGTGLATEWQWVALDTATKAAGTALVPVTTSTALSTVLATSVGPYLGGTLIPQVLGYGAFGLGSVALGTIGLGAFDALTHSGGRIEPWAQNPTTDVPSSGATGGLSGKEPCKNCGKNPCECPTTCSGNTITTCSGNEVCINCGKDPCECNKDETCPICGLPMSECPGHSNGDEEVKCPTCGLPISQCPGHGNGGEVAKCPTCGLPLSQCPGHGSGDEEVKCPTCGLPLSQCPGHGTEEEEKCPTCGLPISQCPGHGTEEEEKCPTCGLPISQCPGHGTEEEEEKCPTCGLPISQCPGHGTEEEEETCPTCGLPISQCPGHSNEGENSGEEPTDPESGENNGPNVTFKNVGPEWIEMESTNPVIQPSPETGNGGATITIPSNPSTGNSETPEFKDPVSTEPVEPVYEFESMAPTVENPDLANIPAAEVSGPGVQSFTTSVGNSMENISVTSLSDLTQPANNDVSMDTSTLGMGGITFGAAAATMYGANRRNIEEKKDKEEFKRKTEEDKNKFEQI